MPTKLLILVCLVALAGCTEVPTDDAGVDSGVMVRRDSGRSDAARTDSGPGDPCSAGEDNAIDTLGCNGPLYGTTQRANQIDGPCTPDEVDGPGTCMAAAGLEVYCAPDDVDPSAGTCLYICPTAPTYVSTGGCPSGTRCFDLTDFSLCFRDCNSAADCFTGEDCDGDGSCVPPEPTPTDGGVPADAGMATDGGPVDAGAPADAGPPDAST